jgi:shikimate kinase
VRNPITIPEAQVTRPDSGDAIEREDALAELRRQAQTLSIDRPIALVGLMGAGKTTIGRRLANVLQWPFMDADAEIERAAGLTVPEIFAKHGEEDFRRGERSVIARLLAGPAHVLATGGGAFIDDETRANLRQKAVTIWLKAPLEVLMRRVDRRDDRPLLMGGDPRAVMERLMQVRYPIYAEADVTVETSNSPHNAAVAAVIDALLHRQIESQP